MLKLKKRLRLSFLSLKHLKNVRLKRFSRFHRKKLFLMYRHPFYTRFRPNNVFVATFLPTMLPDAAPEAITLSAGRIPDYAKRKKKKKPIWLVLKRLICLVLDCLIIE